MSSESEQVSEPGEASENHPTETQTDSKEGKGKARAAPTPEQERKMKELQEKLKPLLDGNPVLQQEMQGLTLDNMPQFMTSRLEQMLLTAVCSTRLLPRIVADISSRVERIRRSLESSSFGARNLYQSFVSYILSTIRSCGSIY